MILHTVNKSPFDNNALNSCLRVIAAGDTLLLIENGVYAALANTDICDSLDTLSTKCTIATLAADVAARGIANKLSVKIDTIDDADFVELATKSTSVQSWY